MKNLPAERVRKMHVTCSRSPELSLCDRAERPDKPLDLLLGVVIMHRSAHPVAEGTGLRIEPGGGGGDHLDIPSHDADVACVPAERC